VERSNRARTAALANFCELCGSEEDVEVHHERAMRKLHEYKGRPKPERVKRMIALRRKTLVLCRRCHVAIEYGLPITWTADHSQRGQGRSRVLALTVILELMVILYEPCAVKGARTVRRGAVRKGLTDDTTRQRRKGLRKHQHLACRLLYRLMKIGEALEYRCLTDVGGKVVIDQGIAAWSTFVRSQRAFLVVVATEQAIALCKAIGIEVPDVSDEVKRLVEVRSAPP
jgi:hypothetical protein